MLIMFGFCGLFISATVSSYEGYKHCMQKMLINMFIISIFGRAFDSAAVPSYERFKLRIQKTLFVALCYL